MPVSPSHATRPLVVTPFYTPQLRRRECHAPKQFSTPKHTPSFLRENSKVHSSFTGEKLLKDNCGVSLKRVLSPEKCNPPVQFPKAMAHDPAGGLEDAKISIKSMSSRRQSPEWRQFFTPAPRRKNATCSPKPFLTPDHKPKAPHKQATISLPKAIVRKLSPQRRKSSKDEASHKADGRSPSPTPYYQKLASFMGEKSVGMDGLFAPTITRSSSIAFLSDEETPLEEQPHF